MSSYPARVARDGASFVESFPDIPEALTGAPTREEALAMATDTLITAMDCYFDDRRPVPATSAPKRGHVLIELPLSLGAKALLLNEMLAQGTRLADLAKRMNVRPQEVNRLTDFRHPTKIDTIARAQRVFGRRLELSIV